MLEQLIQAEEDRVLDGVEADSAPWQAYWEKAPGKSYGKINRPRIKSVPASALPIDR